MNFRRDPISCLVKVYSVVPDDTNTNSLLRKKKKKYKYTAKIKPNKIQKLAIESQLDQIYVL